MAQSPEKEELGDRDLAFFGAMTASLSHQLNNVFTIINEVNGLLEDLLLASERGGEMPPEKIKAIAGKMGKQVRRGVDYVKRLNRLAHMVDEPEVSLELGEWLGLADGLCRRFAILKRATLEIRAPAEPVTVSTNPFLLLQAVFLCLDIVLQEAGENESLSLRIESGPSGSAVVLEAATPVPEMPVIESKLRLLETIMGRIGGRVSIDDERRSFGLWLG